MYGVPAGLDITHLVDRELTHVGLGEYQVVLAFTPEASISVEGAWELRDGTGAVVDCSTDEAAHERRPFELHRLLGRSVTSVSVHPPTAIALHFEGGFEFRAIDSSPNYESFQIQPGDIIV